MGRGPTHPPSRQPGKMGSWPARRRITSPNISSRGSRAITSGSSGPCRGWAASRPSTRPGGPSRASRRCCGCARASALPARGPFASRTGCSRSASVSQRLTKCETGVGTVHPAPCARVCDKPLQIAREVLTGRIAQAKGDLPAAIAAFERAAVLQEGLAYMEPPYWYYPVRQSLGAALLAAGRVTEAEEAFQAALRRAPNNGWALFGLMEAAKARSNGAAAQDAETRLAKVWVGDRSLLELKRL